MEKINPQIEESWKQILEEEFQKPYFYELKKFLIEEKNRGEVVFPPGKLIFNAFNLCPFDRVKVVILGQDPYPGPGQAHGLCFSVPRGIPLPPSLQNIYKELAQDLGVPPPPHGNLEHWAREGVFLLNTCLTVRLHKPAAHFGKGWENFTDTVIKTLSEKRESLVFLLWGRPAQEKMKLIDSKKHAVFTSPHPSPLSASRGFFGCRHFSKTNQWLREKGLTPVRWTESPSAE